MHFRHPFLEFFFRDYLAVKQMHLALRVLGEPRIVRDLSLIHI